MTRDNFYLELLQEQVKLLDTTIKHKDDYSPRSYRCILAGIVIRMNTVLEECLMEFHSDKFDKVSKLIYTCRQICVHYSSFMDFKDIEQSSLEIVEEFNKVYPNEKQYFQKLLSTNPVRPNNIVVAANRNIKYDEYSNTYFIDTEDKRVIIDANNVTKIQDFRRRKNLSYIIDLNNPLVFVTKDENGLDQYEEVDDQETMRDFFKVNLVVEGENYRAHTDLINEVLESLYQQNYNNVYVQEKVLLDEPDRKPFYMLANRMLDRYFRDHVVYEQFLNDITFTSMPKPSYSYYDYKNIKKSAKEALEKNMSSRDFFFITKGISGFDLVRSQINKNDLLMDEQKIALQGALLINWIDISIRNLSDDFIESNAEFKDAYLKLLKYRAYFAHNPSQLKENSDRIMEEFYDLSQGIMSILSSLDFSKINKVTEPHMVSFAVIERDANDFITYNGEQYLKIDDKNYLGDKLFYSSKEIHDKKVVGLMPMDKHFSYRVAYYNQIDDRFVRQKIGDKRKTKFLRNSDECVDDDTIFDVEFTTLLDVYAKARGRGNPDVPFNSDKQVVIFAPSVYNENLAHAALLDDIISDYYKLRYVPLEFAREIKADMFIENGKVGFEIKDANDEVIAMVMSYNNFRKSFDIDIDKSNDVVVNEVISVRKGK